MKGGGYRMPPGRKKWTEGEERTLIDKYREMLTDGSLGKMKTREKKYKPIALHVNSIHHVNDPVAYPWEWSWKDVSNKVQNMRHQYSLVKQKIKTEEGFDWVEGLSHWSNFLRYKEVFGDVSEPPFGNGSNDLGFGFDENENEHQGLHQELHQGLEFDYHDNEGEVERIESRMGSRMESRKKRKVVEKKAWRFMATQLAQLREMEARFAQREERESERRESETSEMKKLMERLKEEWESRRRERQEEVVEWEEKSVRRRSEWNARVDEMLTQHRAEMAQFHARVLDEQQNLTSQLLGIVSQYATDNTANVGGSSSSHYLSQMMQHVGGMVDAADAAHNHNQHDDFIV